jgi:hypothetical protein
VESTESKRRGLLRERERERERDYEMGQEQLKKGIRWGVMQIAGPSFEIDIISGGPVSAAQNQALHGQGWVSERIHSSL